MARRRKTNSEYNRLMEMAGGSLEANQSRSSGNASSGRTNSGSSRNDTYDRLMRQAGGDPTAAAPQPQTYAQQKTPADIALERLIGTRAGNYGRDNGIGADTFSVDVGGLFQGAQTGVNGLLNQGLSGALKNMGAGLFQGAETGTGKTPSGATIKVDPNGFLQGAQTVLNGVNPAAGRGGLLSDVYDRANGRMSSLLPQTEENAQYREILQRPDFAENSVAQKSKRRFFGGDELYDYINNIGDEREQADMAQRRGTGATDYGKYAFMTEDEIGVYNYLYATEGKKAANRFLKQLEPALNEQWYSGASAANQERALEHPWLYSAATVAAQPARMASSMAASLEDTFRAAAGGGTQHQGLFGGLIDDMTAQQATEQGHAWDVRNGEEQGNPFSNIETGHSTGDNIDPYSQLRQLSRMTTDVRGAIAEDLEQNPNWLSNAITNYGRAQATELEHAFDVASRGGKTNPFSGAAEQMTPEAGGKAASFVYQTAMSAADSAVNMAMAGGLADIGAGALGIDLTTQAGAEAVMKATNVIGSLTMSSEVMSLGVAEAKEKGFSDEGALLTGLIRGAIEYASEAIGGEWVIRNIQANPTQFIKTMVLNMIPEGVEEVMSDVGNGIVNLIMDGLFNTQESGWLQMRAEFSKQGWQQNYPAIAKIMETMGWGNDPDAATLLYYLGEEGLSFLGGAMATLGTSLRQGYSMRRGINATAQAMGTTAADVGQLMQEYQTENPYQIAELGQFFEAESADDFRAKAGTDRTAQEILEATKDERDEKRKAAARTAGIRRWFSHIGADITEAEAKVLADGMANGDTDERTYLDSVLAAYRMGENGNFTLQEAMRSSDAAAKINEVQFRQAFQLGQMRSGAETVDTTTAEGQDRLEASFASMGSNAQMAIDAYEEGQDIDSYAAAMTKAAGLYAANGQDLHAIAEQARSGDRADIVGKLTDAQLDVAMEIGARMSEQRTAAVKQGAAILRAAREASIGGTKRVGTLTMAKTGGSIDGVAYQAVDTKKLTRQQKNILSAVGTVSKALGLDVTVISAEGNVGGAYTGGGHIYLNINSGMNLKGFSKAIAAGSFTHEMTHWLSEYAKEEYEVLRGIVTRNLTADQLDKLVQEQQRVQPKLSYDEALDEVIANAAQPLLENSKAFEQIARENMSLAEKILDYMKKFTEKMKAAFAEIDWKDNLSIYKAVQEMEDHLDEMQKAFDEAILAARENMAAETAAKENTAQKGDVQYMVWEENEEEIRAAIRETVDTAIQNKGVIGGFRNTRKLAKFSDNVVAMISKAAGIDTSEKNYAINGTDVWHEYIEHGNDSDEKERGQIGMSPEKLSEAIAAAYEPDIVEGLFRESTTTHRKSYAYAKKMPDGNYVVIAAVGGNRNPTVTPILMIQLSRKKWDTYMNAGFTLGEMLYENNPVRRAELDVEFNRNNRVTAAQFASDEAIASTPRSPRSDTTIADAEGTVKRQVVAEMTEPEYQAQIGPIDLRNFTEAKGADGESLFQVFAFVNDEPEYRKMLKTAGVLSDTEIDDLFRTVDAAVEKIMANLEELDYAWDQDINDRAFSPVKPNSDHLYKVSVDFSTLCRKRILQGLVGYQLQAALDRALTREEGIAIRDALMELQKQGLQIEVACALCYVESARMGSSKPIQTFLDNRGKVLSDFFAGKDRLFKKAQEQRAEAEERQKIYEETKAKDPASKGLIRGKGDDKTMYDVRDTNTANLKKLPDKIADRIRAAKKAAQAKYKVSAEQQKIIDTANSLTVSDFTTPQGLENLARNHREIYDAYTSYVRSATQSKGIENDVWWRVGDSARSISNRLIEQMNSEGGGLRAQSWSDFQVIHMMDYIAQTIELSTRGAKQHAYTKVIDYVDLMGNTGVMINMSLIPAAVYTGSLEWDDVEGIIHEQAFRMREKYHATAGTIAIGINYNQIRQLLASNLIDYIIPYHRSGMSEELRIAMHIPGWEDYQDCQNEKELSRAEAERNARRYSAILLDEKDPKWHKKPAFSEWFDLKEAQRVVRVYRESHPDGGGRYGVMTGGYAAMQQAAENYKRICAERGLAPKFSYGKGDFVNDDNYWKLLIDRKMVDNVTGDIIEQKPLKPNFDLDVINRILDDELARYGQVKEDQNEAIRRVSEAFLSGKVQGGMTIDQIAETMQKPVDNVTNVNITQSAKMQVFDDPAVAEKARKAVAFNNNQTETGSTLKTLAGSDIKRGGTLNKIQYKIGKVIGGRLYIHKDYIDTAVEANPALGPVIENAERALREAFPDFEYNCINWTKDTNEIQFQEAPGFDTEREPVVGMQVNVSADGTAELANRGKPFGQIWHHKWEWVGNDYSGFDVRKSWEWSRSWLNTIVGPSKGGSLDAWNKQLNEFHLPRDGAQFQQIGVDSAAPVAQQYTSEDTSINQNKLPSVFTNKWFTRELKPGGVNIDIGGGKYDNAAEYLKGNYDVTNMVFDPFNRDRDHNAGVMDFITSGQKADTATCANVLNVINEPEARENVILECAKAIKPDGKAYFLIYEGDKSGNGRPTRTPARNQDGTIRKDENGKTMYSTSWQEHRDAKSYVAEIEKYFDTVVPHSNLIVAENPKANLPQAAWQLDMGGETVRFQQIAAEAMDREHNNWAPTFYSKLNNVVNEWTGGNGKPMPAKMAAGAVIGWLKGKGVKAEEIRWAGIQPWLEGRKSVTQADLQQLLAENQIQIETEVRGGSNDPEYSFFSDYDWENYSVNSLEELDDFVRRIAEDQGFDFDVVERQDNEFTIDYVRKDTNEVIFYAEKGTSTKNTKWSEYRLKGGDRYREILFKMPSLGGYDNRTMQIHWGTKDVMAHARVQDMRTMDGKSVLFVEEIQSDLHNQGVRKGFSSTKEEVSQQFHQRVLDAVAKTNADREWIQGFAPELRRRFEKKGIKGVTERSTIQFLNGDNLSPLDNENSYSMADQTRAASAAMEVFTQPEIERMWAVSDNKRELNAANSDYREATRQLKGVAPDVPFAGSADTYHEYVMKHLLRSAAEGGYDYVGWTTAKQQSDRWSDEYAEGYRIEYDQNIPKFMRKYVKQWGSTVETIHLENGQESWGVPVNAEMKKSVLTEGQPLFQRIDVTNDDTEAEASGRQTAYARLQNENAILARTVKALNRLTGKQASTIEALQKQLHLSKTAAVREDDARSTARSLIKEYGSSADVNAIAEELKSLGDYILQTKPSEIRETEIKDHARDIAAQIISSVSETVDLTEGVGMPQDVAARVTPEQVNPFEAYMGEATEGLANRIAMGAVGGILRQDVTAMDRQKARREELRGQIEDLKAQVKAGDKATQNAYQTIYDLTLALDKAESQYRSLQIGSERRLAEVREQGRARVAEARAEKWEKVAETKKYYQDMIERQREKRENATSVRGYRSKIQKLYKEFVREIQHPTETKHIPPQLMQQAADILSALNMDNSRPGSKAGAALKAKLAALKVAYDAIQKDADFRAAAVYDPIVSEMMQTMIEQVGDTPINRMSREQLEIVYNVLKAMKVTATKALKVQLGEEERNAYEISVQMTNETRSARNAAGTGLFARWLNAQLSPERMFHRLGGFHKNSMWSKVYQMLNAGQLKSTQIFVEGSRIFDKLLQGKDYDAFVNPNRTVDIGLKDENGNAVPITRGMMVSLYMHLMNEDNIRHAMLGGIEIPALKDYYNGRKTRGTERSVRVGGIALDSVKQIAELREQLKETEDENERKDIQAEINDLTQEALGYADVLRGDIEKQLTDYDRKWISAIRELFDNFSKNKINETTMAVYGIKKASVDNYFPIWVDGDFLNTPFESVARDFSIENVGFLKERVSSSKPIRLADASEVAASQLKKVSQYAGLMPVIRDFNKIWEKTQANYADSLKKAVHSVFGDTGTKYVENLMADLNGARSQDDGFGGEFFGRIRGNMAQAALTLSMRTAFGQTASYPTAASVVGWGPLMKALAKGGRSGRVFSRADQDLIEKYSPLLAYRMKGYSSTELGDIASSNDKRARLWRKMRWLTGWIQAMDGATVGRLWYAAEYYVQDHNKDLEKGSEDYYEEVAKVFNNIVEKTQPNYTTMQRPDILRNPNALVRSLTMFLTQRLQNVNIVIDAAATLSQAKKDYAAKRYDVTKEDVHEAAVNSRRAVVSQLVAAATIVAFKAAADAILHNMNAYRREKDKEITAESVSLELLDMFLDSVTGSFLWGSELYDLVESRVFGKTYYGIELSSMSTVTDMIESFNNLLTEMLDNGVSGENFEKRLNTAAKNLASVLGIPLGNAEKIIMGAVYHAQDIANGNFGSFEAGVYWVSKAKEGRWRENLETLGVTQHQFAQMLSASDTDGNGTVTQDEAGAWLDEHIASGDITEGQAEAFWAATGSNWKKTYADWRGKKK